VKGCVSVSIGFLLLATIVSPQAGRIGEGGAGAVWIAPELVATRPVPTAQPCMQTAALRTRTLVFETLEPDEGGIDEGALLTASREVVSFEWNPATGELSYDTSATTGMFSDLAASSPAALRAARSCGSR
jgi:hypothetical protein